MYKRQDHVVGAGDVAWSPGGIAIAFALGSLTYSLCRCRPVVPVPVVSQPLLPCRAIRLITCVLYAYVVEVEARGADVERTGQWRD